MSLDKHILIIDDHQLFSAGLRQILMTVTARDCIHCYSDPEQAISAELPKAISLIILDFYVPGFDIPHWITLFVEKYPNCPVIIISSSVSPSDKKTCFNAGAKAYFEKHLPPDIVLEKIRDILNSPSLQDAKKHSNKCPIQQHGLTNRQMDILIQLSRGYSNKVIAEKLNISPETVKSHLSSVYKQLGFTTRNEAKEWAHAHGMV